MPLGSPPHQPPPPLPASPSGASGSPRASGSSQVPPPNPPPPSTNQEDLYMDDDMAPDAQAQSSDDEDIRNAYIPKMKAAYYPDVGLEQMVPDQMWIKEECKYDIVAIAVRTHMWILSVVRIEVFSMYGAVTFQDRYRVQMIMRFNEIHKFSHGTLQQIDEALDY
nr:hypothetical protein [Tanacetum cinerariifolium]GEY92699.1 hypothetical protein [Tanacetum cinerariifolium]